MSINLFDHIAFATTNTEKSVEIFSILGFKKVLFHSEILNKFGSYITKLQGKNGEIIELVQPWTKQSVVNKLLNSQEATIYHSAFYTDNLSETLEALKSKGAVVVTEPMSIPYPVTQSHKEYKTSHVFHPNIGLFEITGPLLEMS